MSATIDVLDLDYMELTNHNIKKAYHIVHVVSESQTK